MYKRQLEGTEGGKWAIDCVKLDLLQLFEVARLGAIIERTTTLAPEIRVIYERGALLELESLSEVADEVLLVVSVEVASFFVFAFEKLRPAFQQAAPVELPAEFNFLSD